MLGRERTLERLACCPRTPLRSPLRRPVVPSAAEQPRPSAGGGSRGIAIAFGRDLRLLRPLHRCHVRAGVAGIAPRRRDQAADAIVVLGAAQYDGRPSPVLPRGSTTRSSCGRQGLAPLIVVTGGKQPGDRFTEATASANYLLDRGVPDAQILPRGAGTHVVGVARRGRAHPARARARRGDPGVATRTTRCASVASPMSSASPRTSRRRARARCRAASDVQAHGEGDRRRRASAASSATAGSCGWRAERAGQAGFLAVEFAVPIRRRNRRVQRLRCPSPSGVV